MSVQWTSVAIGVPHAKAILMPERLERAAIQFLAAETTSWIGKLRAFVEGEPDLSLFVDKADVDRAKSAIGGIVNPAEFQQTTEDYVRSLNNDQLKSLLASTGWPDLVLDTARQLLRERTVAPAPIPRHSEGLPLMIAGLCMVLGPLGSWIARQIIPRAQPWEDKLIPLYDETTQTRCRRCVNWGMIAFIAWILLLFVVKCVK